MSDIKQNIKNYYGDTLTSTQDLKTSACCPTEAIPAHLRPYLKNIHKEITDKFYGCGSPIPSALEGKTVLDLGCGTGRDCYLLAQLVGESGQVIGVDMTENQLVVAKQHEEYHREKFGYQKSNLRYHYGDIEDLAALGIADNSVDVVVSNCVINLSANKETVFAEIHRVLKPGGELYFSDIFADRRIPESLQNDPILRGECLGGALYLEDFRRVMQRAGFRDYRITSGGPIALNDAEVIAKIGMVGFYSYTIRSFKCDFEDRCENFGHVAYYQGGIAEAPHGFALDDHHYFPKDFPVPVCGNTAKMLMETRYSDFFRVTGDFSTHFGLFDCGPVKTETHNTGGCC